MGSTKEKGGEGITATAVRVLYDCVLSTPS